jgi:hypothetical protein
MIVLTNAILYGTEFCKICSDNMEKYADSCKVKLNEWILLISIILNFCIR